VILADGRKAGLRPIVAVEADETAAQSYARALGHRPRVADIRHVMPSELPAVDVLGFGFPCSDFSEMGRRRGLRGAHGPLYLEAVRLLRALRPMAFVAENVRALRSAHGGRALDQIRRDLARSGYRVVAHLMRAHDYDVAQMRERIFIVGIRRDVQRTFQPPAPSSPDAPTVAQALDKPLPPGAGNAEPMGMSEMTAARLRHIRPGESLWQAQARPDFPKELRDNRPVDKRYRGYLRRLDPDRPAWTIVASGGGGAKTYHHREPRPLTNRERARLQGIGDEIAFAGARNEVRRQIGMAVPPPLARAVFEALLKTLFDIPYAAVAPNLFGAVEPAREPGRPARVEAKTDIERARDYRRNREHRMRAKARLCRELIRADPDKAGCFADLDLIASFVARTLPDMRTEMSGRSVPPVPGQAGMTRSQLYRARRARELAAVEALLQAHAAGRLRSETVA
jgi:DNA (cytosine-5)-methyltransferase 1